ncbi:MAG: hypothetical protein HQL32_06595, partial [Planctomycetes bacterium]|nr:hypothetical protein [Planctomycetota bacterium]
KGDDYFIDFAKVFSIDGKDYPIREGTKALICAPINSPQSGILHAGAGADWWMQWALDGEVVLSTSKKGNQTGRFHFSNHEFKANVTAGDHILSAQVKSGSGGWRVHTNGGSEEAYRALHIAAEKRIKKLKDEREFKARVQKNSRMKIVVFGSSVAHGYGAANMFGWANQMGERLAKRNWEYVNKSIGGDNTSKLLARIDRDVFSEKPDVVLIGLSLANEGIRGLNPEGVYKQYIRNMKKLIQVIRKHGCIPVVSNCYPHALYNEKSYGYVRSFNAELATWPVASIDLMGAVDNGQGRWQKGQARDAGHPNDIGHTEMSSAVVDSLFDGLIGEEQGTITPTLLWYEVPLDEKDIMLRYSADSHLKSYTFGWGMRCDELPSSELVLYSSENVKLFLLPTGQLKVHIKNQVQTNDMLVDMGQDKVHHIAIAYRHATGKLCLYVDGMTKEYFAGKLSDSTFELRAEGVRVRNAFVYYSAIATEWFDTLFYSKRIPKSSLAVFSPLDDGLVIPGVPLLNLTLGDKGFEAVRIP